MGIHDASRTTVCEVSRTVSDRPPDDPSAGTLQVLEARGTRTPCALWGVVVGQAVRGEYKVLWVRPRGVQVRVGGDRLDGRPASLLQTFPATDSRATLEESSSLAFPGPGCWRVSASSGKAGFRIRRGDSLIPSRVRTGFRLAARKDNDSTRHQGTNYLQCNCDCGSGWPEAAVLIAGVFGSAGVVVAIHLQSNSRERRTGLLSVLAGPFALARMTFLRKS